MRGVNSVYLSKQLHRSICMNNCDTTLPLFRPLRGEVLFFAPPLAFFPRWLRGFIFFACPKKTNQKKRHPGGAAPSGYPALLALLRARLTRRSAPQTRGSLFRKRAAVLGSANGEQSQNHTSLHPWERPLAANGSNRSVRCQCPRAAYRRKRLTFRPLLQVLANVFKSRTHHS